MWLKNRQHLMQSDFLLVEKYNYAEAPKLTAKYGIRNYVSEKELYESTDSLFRYEVDGLKVGSIKSKFLILCDKTNCLLTLSTKDVSSCVISRFSYRTFLLALLSTRKNIHRCRC